MDIFEKLQNEIKILMRENDPAHDLQHIMRVFKNAKIICSKEKINPKLVLCAVLLHDIVSYPKLDKRSKKSSMRSAFVSRKILKNSSLSKNEVDIIYNAIVDHSFSRKKVPFSIEGKILQDADRLDALGAIGIARVFAVSGAENRTFYNTNDPFCLKRNPNDQKWALDHFYKKLLNLENTMNTKSGKIEAKRRTKILKQFLSDFKQEIYP